jgi:hypothetical protein
VELKSDEIIYIRAYRPASNMDKCLGYLEGHKNILSNHGIPVDIVMRQDWFDDEAVVLVVAEMGGVVLGGARMHSYGKSKHLPIFDSLSDLDPDLRTKMQPFASDGLFEICGLWNSYKTAGMGIGSMKLVKSCISVAQSLSMNNGVVLCSPFTNRVANDFGFRPFRLSGHEGSYPYPTEKFISTIQFNCGVRNLFLANPNERELINGLRAKGGFEEFVTMPNGFRTKIQYELNYEIFQHS